MADFGHNSAPGGPTQWQTPHLPEDHHHHDDSEAKEPDLDLVESVFIQGFTAASDPTSFLRLARIPFVTERDGARLSLLHVRIDPHENVWPLVPPGQANHQMMGTSKTPKWS